MQLPDKMQDHNPKLRLTERLTALDEMLRLMELFVEAGSKMVKGQDDKELKLQIVDLRKTVRVARELLKGDEAAYMTSFLYFASQEIDDKAVPVNVKKVIPVMVEIANAETSKDVAAVIEAAAAPVGSYRQKSKRQMTSITAFLGPSLGREYYDNNQGAGQTKLNAFAPVGIHASWPLKGDYFNNFGVYLSLLDLGPLVSTREEDGVKSESNVGFKQAFSPGIYGTMHLFGPVNFGIGASKTPGLAEKTTGGEISVWRVQGFLGVDLTLFPF